MLSYHLFGHAQQVADRLAARSFSTTPQTATSNLYQLLRPQQPRINNQELTTINQQHLKTSFRLADRTSILPQTQTYPKIQWYQIEVRHLSCKENTTPLRNKTQAHLFSSITYGVPSSISRFAW